MTVVPASQDAFVERREYPGKINFRLVYGDVTCPWWSQLNVRVKDVPALVEGTGWGLEDHLVLDADHYVKLRRL